MAVWGAPDRAGLDGVRTAGGPPVPIGLGRSGTARGPWPGPLAAHAARRAVVLAPMALGACAVALLALCGVGVVLSLRGGIPPAIMDFDVFHIVGGLVWRGRLADAYAAPTMELLENALGRSGTGYLPFAYPPPFALMMATLAGLAAGPAYAAFTAAGFTLFAVALRHLAGAWFWPVVLATSPVLFINVEGGQNGMLTAGLAGLSAALALKRRGGAAGAVAGLLASLKPQTCVALPLLFVLRRDWRAVAAMAATAAALSGVTVAALGPGIVPAFLAGLSRTGQLLAEGHFPLHRMTSVYACLRTFGVPTDVALPLHVGVAATMLCAVAALGRRLRDPRAACGLTLIATAFVSPYFYDYDVTIVGIGLALVLPDLAQTLTRAWICALLMGVALAGSAGIVQVFFLPTKLSLGAPILLVWTAVIVTALRGRTGPARDPEAGSGDPPRQSSTCVPSSTTRLGGMPK